MLKPRAAWLVVCGAVTRHRSAIWSARPSAARLPQAAACGDPNAPSGSRSLLHHLPQQDAQDGGLALDGFDLTRVGDRAGHLGTRRAQAAHARDAAAGTAPARSGHLRSRRVGARSRARRGRGRQSQSGPRHRPSAEPDRVHERGSRSAGARHRRAIAAARRRTRSAGLRQRGGRALGLAAAARELSRCGRHGEPARDWRSLARHRREHVQDSDRAGPGRSHERRPSLRIARRHLHSVSVPARRRIPHQGAAEASALSVSDRHGRAAPDRHSPRRHVDQALHDRRRREREDGAGELCRQHAGRSGLGSLHAHGGRRPHRESCR